MHFVVVDTHRFVKISRHLYYYRRCCNIYAYFSLLLLSFLSRIVLCLFLSNIVKLVFNSIKTVKKKHTHYWNYLIRSPITIHYLINYIVTKF